MKNNGKSNRIFLLIILVIVSFLIACSSSTETTQKKTPKTEDEDYIFDEIPDENKLQYESDKTDKLKSYYLIQIGAFSTKDRAVAFSALSKSVLKKECTIKFDEAKKLYLVRLAQVFSTKEEAELMCEIIREQENYEDAWIVKEIEKKHK